jgi:internalin A
MTDEELLEVIKQAARDRSTQLDLSNRNLSNIPKEIGKLSHLIKLYLNNNQLVRLPDEIGELTKLRILNLNNNLLNTLPINIGQLSELREFHLYGNKIASLPKGIGKLVNLDIFNLNCNQLISLPMEIGQLVNLSRLKLHSNKIEILPKEVGKLNNLIVFELDGNLSLSLPHEIRGRGHKEIIDFYRQKFEQETDHIYEAKLLIIGEAGAGKTTLANKIQSINYELKDEDSTQGIDVSKWQFPLSNGKNFNVNIWDFGGQEIYHTTHRFFLTKRSLYTLVIDTRKEDTNFHYWLNVVELLSGNSPLLIIKNEKQERQQEINERQLRGEFTNLKETLSTNLLTKRGLPEILTQIKHYISNLPHVGTELPKTWIKVRAALEQEQRNYISLDEFIKLCEVNGFTRLDDKLQLSSYLHDLGVCLHFQEDDLLSRTIILKPTWGTDAVYKVLDNPQVIKNQGVFTRDDLKNIWCEEQYISMQPELLQLMINFKLCYEIPNSPKTYIALQLLTPNQPDYNWDESGNLLLRYKYEFMPKGILTRFIVEMHPWIERQSYVWKNGVILSKDGARAEVIEIYRYHKGEIHIRVSGMQPRDLMTNIRYELDKIHSSYNSASNQSSEVQGLKYKTLVPCNCCTCKSSQTPYFYSLDNLHNFRNKNILNTQYQTSGDMIKVSELIDDVDFGKFVLKENRKSRLENTIKLELEIRYEKSASLRKRLAIETDPVIIFKIEKDIEKEEEKITGLEDKLDEIQ